MSTGSVDVISPVTTVIIEIMNKFFNSVFIGLGVVFLTLVLLLGYMFIADPFGLKPLIFGTSIEMQTTKTYTMETPTTNTEVSAETATAGFELSNAQKQALISLGIDPAMVPSYVSATQEECFVSVLGEARVGEIRAGAVPNGVEFLRAKACI